MSMSNIGDGSGAYSNPFYTAGAGSSKSGQARNAGLNAQKSQQNSFRNQMQGLVAAASAEMSSGYGSKYTNALKISNSVEQGLSLAADTEVQKVSQRNLDDMKERIADKAEQAREESAAEDNQSQGTETAGTDQSGSADRVDLSADGQKKAVSAQSQSKPTTYKTRGEIPGGSDKSADLGGSQSRRTTASVSTKVDVVA